MRMILLTVINIWRRDGGRTASRARVAAVPMFSIRPSTSAKHQLHQFRFIEDCPIGLDNWLMAMWLCGLTIPTGTPHTSLQVFH